MGAVAALRGWVTELDIVMVYLDVKSIEQEVKA